MVAIQWDQAGERKYETGVDRGVLYHVDNTGAYNIGYGWNGLTSVNETPSGAEPNPQYADNIKYLNLTSAEDFGGTITAFSYPPEFGINDGTAEPVAGVLVGQQGRRPFGFSFRTKIGNDLEGMEHGYKLHLVYGATATPSERAYSTVNESPEAAEFSWEFTTIPVDVGTIGGTTYKPTAILTIDSTKVNQATLEALEELLYGTAGTDPSLPLPGYVIDMFDGTVVTTAAVTPPSYNSSTDVITIPSVTGVVYMINGEVVTGTVNITASTVVNAKPAAGYRFPTPSVSSWLVTYA